MLTFIKFLLSHSLDLHVTYAIYKILKQFARKNLQICFTTWIEAHIRFITSFKSTDGNQLVKTIKIAYTLFPFFSPQVKIIEYTFKCCKSYTFHTEYIYKSLYLKLIFETPFNQ